MLKKWDARTTYLFMRGMGTFAFTVFHTMSMVYQVVMVGLSPLQLVLMGTTLEVTVLLFEIPTGVVADVYSRRLSVIIGYVLVGVGFMLEGVPTLFTVWIAQVFWGIGATFVSGAAEAWIVDEIGQQEAQKVFLRSAQLQQIVSFLAIWLSVALATVQLNLPHFIAGGLFIALSAALILIMPETGFQRVPKAQRETWRDLRKTLSQGVQLIRVRRILLLIVLSTLLVGAFSEGWDRLWTAHILQGFGLPSAVDAVETVVLFGIIGSVTAAATLTATEWVRRRKLESHAALSTGIALAYAFVFLGVLSFTLVGHLWLALLALWTVEISRAVAEPLYSAWINQHTESRVRATVLSMASQANAVGQISGGVPVGIVGNLAGIRTAIRISALLMLPAVGVAARIRRLKADYGEAVQPEG